MSREQEDRAREWTNENYPELDGPAWDAAYAEALADLAAIDDACDAIEGNDR